MSTTPTRRRHDRDAQRERFERQREQQREQNALQEAFNANGNLDRSWMEDILDTDDLEEHLDQFQLNKIRALINKQWILANLTNAQTHDRWYKLEVMKLKTLGEFPPPESAIQGGIRAGLRDDETEQLQALTAEERNIIDQVFTTFQNMVTRSREGFERQQVNTSIARTESENRRQTDDGGVLKGLFSR